MGSSFVSYSLLLKEHQKQEESSKIANQRSQQYSMQGSNKQLSSFVSYSLLLKEHQKEEESLKIAQQLQAEEEKRQRHQRMKQEYNDERMAVKMMLRTAMMEEESPVAT